MKRKTLNNLLVVFILFHTHYFVYGQDIDSINGNYLYLFNGEVVKGNDIVFESKPFQQSYLMVDGTKYDQNLVKFYNYSEGFYANTKFLSSSKKSNFAKRIESGKINIYEKTVTKMSAGTMSYGVSPQGPTSTYHPGSPTTASIEYYNKQYGAIKKVKYKNLKLDLVDNPESMRVLNQYKRLNGISIGAFVLSAAILIPSISAWENNEEKYENRPPAGLIVGGVLFSGNFLLTEMVLKPDKLREAIKEYNK